MRPHVDGSGFEASAHYMKIGPGGVFPDHSPMICARCVGLPASRPSLAAQLSLCMSSEVTAFSAELRTEFGEIDIYLFDQLLRGRFDQRRRILDAGCGAGRNLPYFLRRGFDVRAVDADAAAIRSVRQLVTALNPALPLDQIHHGSLDSLPWDNDSTDAVICSAV